MRTETVTEVKDGKTIITISVFKNDKLGMVNETSKLSLCMLCIYVIPLFVVKKTVDGKDVLNIETDKGRFRIRPFCSLDFSLIVFL